MVINNKILEKGDVVEIKTVDTYLHRSKDIIRGIYFDEYITPMGRIISIEDINDEHIICVMMNHIQYMKIIKGKKLKQYKKKRTIKKI